MIIQYLTIQSLAYLNLIAANIIHDAILINFYKKEPKHSANVYVIAGIAINIPVYLYINEPSLLYIIPAIMYVPTRWNLHDPLVNLLTKKPASYIGKLPKNSKEFSIIDVRFLGIEPKWQYHFKALLFVICLVASIISYNAINYYF